MSLPGVTRNNFTMRSLAKLCRTTWLDFVMPPVLVLMMPVVVVVHWGVSENGDRGSEA